MRLGREQAAGYVEDTEIDSIAVAEIKIDAEERARPAPDPQPSIVVG
jgi:hypothetical protein